MKHTLLWNLMPSEDLQIDPSQLLKASFCFNPLSLFTDFLLISLNDV